MRMFCSPCAQRAIMSMASEGEVPHSHGGVPMLVLSRKVGEEIVIGDNIRLKVLSIRGNQIRLGFTAPKDVVIHREELTQQPRKADEEKAASTPSSTSTSAPLPTPDVVI